MLLLLLGITLSLPFVQTKIGTYVTDMLNKDFKCDIKVEQVSITIFGTAKLKTVLIKDHHKDTLFYANRIQTNILDIEKLIHGDLIFGDIRIDGLFFNMKQYKNEKESNLGYFIDLFETGKPSTGHFLMKAKNVYLSNSHFNYINENSSYRKYMDATKINASLSNFLIYGSDFYSKINKMSFKDHRGLFIKNLSGKYSYTNTKMMLENMDIVTKNSTLKGKAKLIYKHGDFSDFNNKVKFDLKIDKSTLSTTDIRYFYDELGKNRIFDFKSHITGTLNNLTFTNLHLYSERKSEIKGNVNFKNLLGDKNHPFYMKGNFSKVNSNYDNLIGLLPNILGKSLPSSLKKIGQFNLKGSTELTTSAIDAKFFMATALGNVESDLQMTNIDNIDNANYSGKIIFDNFDLGKFLGKKNLEKVSLNLNVKGKGFVEKYLNTTVTGTVSKIRFYNYTYTRIKIDGNFKSPFFKGKVNINDPNLFMDFDGLVDLSQKENKYDFLTRIDYANFNKLNLTKDSVSVFKGDIMIKMAGNTLDNLNGKINITNTSFQNNKDLYLFEDFSLESTFDDQKIRTISVHSPDVIEGKIIGRFKFNQLRKVVENAAGSLYANYRPNKVQPKQFLNFNINVYNKIIEIFYPEIEIGNSTVLKGNIDSDKNEFKLNFSSPTVKAFENHFDKVKIDIDNTSKLYNTYVEMDSIKTKHYKISKFSLLNVTKNDTLFARTEFNGGNKAEDSYKLNLYHTIDEQKNSVVGIRKSELTYKNNLWYLNENQNTDENKIVFDKDFKHILFDKILLTHGNEKMSFDGELHENSKDLKLEFENVSIENILPRVDNFAVTGKLNGKIDFIQDKTIFQPSSYLEVDDLSINEIDLGNLNLNIEGDETLKKFSVQSVLENDNFETFKAEGNFSIVNKEPILDLDLRFDKFNLASLSPLGGEIISNIRGFVSGSSNISGSLNKQDINGRLFLKEAGLKIPYLNTDYVLQDNSIVDLSENQFILQDITLTDSKFNTNGKLNGYIRHNVFTDWNLGINIYSDRLLVLNTPYTEGTPYYGVAFIDGTASLTGPTDRMSIVVNAKSKKGTEIKIPISDVASVSESPFVKFISPLDKYLLEKGLAESEKKYHGLDLKFDLDLNRDAQIEVILDPQSGHGMKGTGTGNLFLEINTLGKFNMYGDYQIYEGYYNFKYKSLIDKRFAVKKFSSIVWEGDPMKARLDMEAVYTVPGGANPAQLLGTSSVNKKVPVDVSIKITGNLTNPEPDFNINFPTASTGLLSEVQNKLSSKDMRQTQALALLATGGFVGNEGVNSNSLESNLYENVGSMFGSLFQNPDDKLKVGVNLVPTNKTAGAETEGQVGVTVSGQINDRVSVNGKLGVPIGGINQSAVVGNFDIQYRVNDDGSLNLRAFNRENEVNYVGQGIGYTQGGGITYEADFNTFQELLNKIFKKKTKQKKQTKKVDLDQDSDNNPAINFQGEDKKNKKKSTSKPNKDGIPHEEEDF